MNDQIDKNRLDELIARSINSELPQFDPASWEKKFPEESKMLKSRAAQPLAPRQNIWRIIMKRRIFKLAVAAAIVVVAVITLRQFGSPFESDAWADVMENVRSSKTLTCMYRTSEKGPPIVKIMVIDPDLLRFEILLEEQVRREGGDILIIDTDKWKSLALNTVNKTATASTSPADKEMLGMYDTMRDFRNMKGFTVEEIGNRRIGDKQAVGFKLKKDDKNREIIVWADPETKLPILMEETCGENREGQVRKFFITDIVFDSELDVSLFSLEPPDGYEFKEADYSPMVAAANRTKSAFNVHLILKACGKYVAEHDGQWPDSLRELGEYGVANKTFVNPSQPDLEVGYRYLKPPASTSKSRIVLHEVYGSWNDGINVGFADYHVEFIKDESDFKNRLGKN